MFARLTTIQGRPEKLDDAIRVLQNDVIPASKMLPGFKHGYWYTDKKSGKMIALTLFETEKDLQSSDAGASLLRKTASEKLGFDILNVESFEEIARV